MRTKAKESLKRLKALKNKKRKFVSVSELDRETWTECSVLEVRYVSLGDSKTTLRYIELISWANKNCKGNYTSDDRRRGRLAGFGQDAYRFQRYRD